jgi:hypothetical protein
VLEKEVVAREPYPESSRAGIEILNRVPAGVSTVFAQSAGMNADRLTYESWKTVGEFDGA